MAININKYVLWLNVPIDYVLRVQVLKTEQQLSKIKASLILRKLLYLTQMKEHLAARA